MSGESDKDGPGGRRLAPPSFPPGSVRTRAPRVNAATDDLSSAFISPDDPLPERGGERLGEGFISPDAPMPRRSSRPLAVEPDAEEGVVTGMGDDAHMELEELTLGFDPHVLELVDAVGKLAEALKRKGEGGLRTTPDMTRFQATLRSYCVGYLAGRRAEDEEG